MNCVNCGHENPNKALICYWCGLDPNTGESPYQALNAPSFAYEAFVAVPEIALPAPIEVPPPLPVPSVEVGMAAPEALGLEMPEIPPIEIAPPPDIADQGQFTAIHRRRARHRPVVHAARVGPVATRPVLPGWGRLLVFIVGLGLLFVLGSALVAAVGAASFGGAFCLAGLLGLAVVLWVGALMARAGKRVVAATGAVYERLEVLGRSLREVAPGMVKELPVNLPAKMGVLDLPVTYSQLRALDSQKGQPPSEQAVDLLTGAIASLVGRDDVILARRTYPVQTRGALARPASREVSVPVLIRRRIYVGPEGLEEQIARILRTDRPMSVEELMQALVGTPGRQRAQQVLTWVERALAESPPDLDALDSPDAALAELEGYRKALRQADPELYRSLEEEIRRGLGGAVRRSAPSSLLDLARSASTAGERSS
jgi:hypothetical protein